MEIYGLPDKKFNIIVLNELSVLQKNIGNKWNQKNEAYRKWDYQQKTVKNNQIEILELKITVI